MRPLLWIFLVLFVGASSSCRGEIYSGRSPRLQVLYNSLDPSSLSQHLAFYELYSETFWGKQALQETGRLLWREKTGLNSACCSEFAMQVIASLVNKPIDQEPPLLDRAGIDLLERLSRRLSHHTLGGHQVWSESEVLTLPAEEIDLARGLFLAQFGADRGRIEVYEAMIDLMALQILLRLPPSASAVDKIAGINTFIFEEMGFRFPPRSLHEKCLDLYTFLPFVLNSRRGVCLGVSFLYLCIAQRLGLQLEAVTPPGHIYIRYRKGDVIINIETTARGIHIDSKDYLSVNTCALQQRTIKEVIGMAHINHASVYWQNGEFSRALEAYRRAELYMRDDPLVKELMGYLLLLTEDRVGGEKRLREIAHIPPEYTLVKDTLVEDYFLGRADAQAIQAVLMKTEEDRQSLLDKKRLLEDTLARCPQFRSALLSLASVWMELHRPKEAISVLEACQSLDGSDPEVHYGLSILYFQRRDFPRAWFHLRQAEAIAHARDHDPTELKELRRKLLHSCAE